MERAGHCCFEWIYEAAPRLFPKSLSSESDWVFNVVCGKGNNGGDGLVIARYLQRNGYNVVISVVHFSDKASADFKTNFDKLGKTRKEVIDVKKTGDIPGFSEDSVIIDALFGTGLNRPVEGIAAEVIEAINASGARVVSIDMPSGLFDRDNAGNDLARVVRCHHALTFQVPRLSFFLADNAEIIGRMHVLDIGLHPDFMASVETDYHYFTREEAAQMRLKRSAYSHKGTFGHALLVGGSNGKYGAPVLSAKACMRAGAGRVTVAVPAEGASAIHAQLPEVMVAGGVGTTHIERAPDLKPYTVIGVGPGLGKSDESGKALKLMIQESPGPMVIDADALNILAENPTWMAFLPKNSILTPHPGEFARLAGKKLSHFDAMEKQRELSQKFGVYILLKGAHSSLSFPDGQVLINSTGNPGMATAGMGDALTGIITGLLASGYSPLAAAALGMFLHGRAGDLALRSQSAESLITTDLIDHLGKAFESLNEAH